MYNIIGLGSDCSLAATLRNLELRQFALPFDWVCSSPESLEACFKDNFNKYHCNLKLTENKKRLVDHYGFEFPHDYPLTNTVNIDDRVGEGHIGEEEGQTISDNWKTYYGIVKAKYDRRIERFIKIMNDPLPLIVLSRYNISDFEKIKDLVFNYYNKFNIVFINACHLDFQSNNIILCNPERGGDWNNINIWKESIDKAVTFIEENF